MGLQLTFLNTSHAPTQGAAETKRMRAHVNKVNFAKRRQRLIEEQRGKHDTDAISKFATPELHKRKGPSYISADQPLLTMTNHTTSSIHYLLCQFRPFVFPEGIGGPGSAAEAAWVHLLLSEPALVEASVSIGLKHNPRRQCMWGLRESAIRKGRAIKMINERLDTPSGLTDGLLSAVFTLTWAEHLGSDANAMKIHSEGLAQMIKLRRLSGNNDVPPWLSDFLLYASMAHNIPAARDMHKQLIQALCDNNTPDLMDINYIQSQIDRLCQDIDAYHADSKEKDQRKARIDVQFRRLQSDVDTLLRTQDHHIRTLRRSIQLFLLLLWPSTAQHELRTLAKDLRQALEEPHIRLCSTVDLPVWQFSVGASAADPQGDTRSWFIDRLTDLSVTMNVRMLEQGTASLASSFMPDACVLEKFKAIWRQVDCSVVHRSGGGIKHEYVRK
ncbi:hypothetical protein PFICI_08229 [Pestalotiopsis fici W106-1]|uniref:Uncharacterized protein n=1 Tax=Pestalotiopsis fici (strain W106-1 / CGMCC3.15140) TaxID=1229662 RepID=W3X3P4_PESFW|nr:uncharacterized protein PFICI_08229 [Pestalotiopsis fici W106-1]ETS80700.1 hypothetical protein PFICI_08229 [Pestalotiopsis fici W106-1]